MARGTGTTEAMSRQPSGPEGSGEALKTEPTHYYVAVSYPSASVAEKVRAEVAKKGLPEDTVSIFRPNRKTLIAISEEEVIISLAQRILTKGGTEFEPSTRVLEQLIGYRVISKLSA
jgi:hypothetical protein